MTRRGGRAVLAASLAIACLCAALVLWRLAPHRQTASQPAAQTPTATPVSPQPAGKPSPIIDAPGEPVFVARGQVSAPKETLIFALPARLGQDVPKLGVKAFFVNSPLVSTTGGYMGKFQESGRDADALSVQLLVNSEQMAGVQSQAQIDAGSDDDGGADTPADAQNLVLTSANSNQIETQAQGPPQLKEAVLRTPVPEKISDLLIANGFGEESARMIESAAKDSSHHVETLPAQSMVLAAGQLDVTGEYRVRQIAIFENGEYIVTIAWKDEGGYDEAAEPVVPSRLLYDSGGTTDVAIRYTLADGVYSAGLRNGMPEPAIREAIQLVGRLTDLKAPLQADEKMQVLYASEYRDKARSSGKVVYVGLRGGAGPVDCYPFEGSDGAFHCFDPKSASEPKTGEPGKKPVSETLSNSGATSVGGILAPIQGAPITSLFGMRFHPILHILRLHAGIDFGAPVGSQVRAAADGTVEIAEPVSGFGNHVRIQHAGFETSYSHLSEILVRPETVVKQGDIVGLSGNTGLSTGPHLHFEFYLDRVAVDPLPHLGSEVQSRIATAPMGGPSALPPSVAVTAGDIESFTNIKAYLDHEIAKLLQ